MTLSFRLSNFYLSETCFRLIFRLEKSPCSGLFVNLDYLNRDTFFFYGLAFHFTKKLLRYYRLSGRTASYLTAPPQIPACGTTALGSSEILASVKDKLVLPSLLFPAVRFAFVPPVLLARQMFPLQARYSVSPFLYFIEYCELI